MDEKAHPVEISDVSGWNFGQRYQNFVKQFGGSDPKKWTNETLDLARWAALEEMANEQHAMLMALCDKAGIKGGWE